MTSSVVVVGQVFVTSSQFDDQDDDKAFDRQVINHT